jgi:hypothetical protein
MTQILNFGCKSSELSIYVSMDVSICGYFSKPNGVHEQNSLRNTGLYCFWQARLETDHWISAENASYIISDPHHHPPYTVKLSLTMLDISIDTCIIVSE